MTSHASLLPAITRFALGGIVTAPFSASLACLARDVDWRWVLFVGMVVPSFTWIVQITASAALMRGGAWRSYWDDLSVVCLIGSAALLPAAIANVAIAGLSGWWSAANVIASVTLMAVLMFVRSRGVRAIKWPISWCATIAINMAIFVFSSRSWWAVD